MRTFSDRFHVECSHTLGPSYSPGCIAPATHWRESFQPFPLRTVSSMETKAIVSFNYLFIIIFNAFCAHWQQIQSVGTLHFAFINWISQQYVTIIIVLIPKFCDTNRINKCQMCTAAFQRQRNVNKNRVRKRNSSLLCLHLTFTYWCLFKTYDTIKAICVCKRRATFSTEVDRSYQTRCCLNINLYLSLSIKCVKFDSDYNRVDKQY